MHLNTMVFIADIVYNKPFIIYNDRILSYQLKERV